MGVSKMESEAICIAYTNKFANWSIVDIMFMFFLFLYYIYWL